MTELRELVARTALAEVPKLLTLLDRNRHGPTYGCFDRNHWHYKIIDFPSGMAQEFVLPLALAWDTDVPGNPYHRAPALREWVRAGIHFAAASAHRDGSTDDYYPFERATGAAAFSLLAALESYRVTGLDDETARRFFARRADWLATCEETGRLTNHQALVALCLLLAGEVLGTSRWRAASMARLDRVLAWQHAEGWFAEYEGCDPGYQTLTIGALAWAHRIAPRDDVWNALVRAVEFVAWFVHPDGSFGGEYGSRNTYNFFPHGFEIVGRRHPAALAINDRVLRGAGAGRASCHADDHIVGHHVWSLLLAWRDWVPTRPPLAPPPSPARAWFPGAGLLVDRRHDCTLVVATNKGGVFKLFRGDGLVASDTHLSVVCGRGQRRRNAVAHLAGDYEHVVGDDEIVVRGDLGWAKHRRMTPRDMVVLRLVMVTAGRFLPNLVRWLLQRMLIVGKRPAPLRFERRLRWREDTWEVEDHLWARRWDDVREVAIGTDQTSIYVAMSRTFQVGQLLDWTHLGERARGLAPGAPLTLVRRPS
jgi:hypothetical protein